MLHRPHVVVARSRSGRGERTKAPARWVLFGGCLVVASMGAPLVQAADVACYFDSVAGDNGKSGLSEDEARQDYTNVPSTCTVAKYKRGSVWNLAFGDTLYPPKKASSGGTTGGAATSKIKTLTNYGDASLPQPKFIKQREHNNGGMVNAMMGGLTIDGIYLEGAESDAQMKNLQQGICIFAGGNMKILNNEITNCDIGMMLSGEGSLVQGNYVHDLHVVVDAPPGVDPNLVGGAEGIFINGSNNEVAYNTFVDCSDHADWTGGNCDGGATEVSIGGSGGNGGGEVTGIKIHHNFAYNTCGFFEVSSMGNLAGLGGGTTTGGTKGIFSDSAFYSNVIIDSGWLSLLQVSNTDLVNVRWENNTLVQRAGSVNSGIIAVVYGAGGECSSGMCGGSLQPNTVFWTNNLFVFDGVMKPTPDKNFVQTTNLILAKDPGFVNLKGTKPEDFALTAAATDAIDRGTPLGEVTLDFINAPIPDPNGKPDIGAFELNSEQTSVPPVFPGTINPSHGNQIGKGGSGGPTATGTGGTGGPAGGAAGTTRPAGTGGVDGLGGSSAGVPALGGSTVEPQGGAGSSGTTVTATGGAGAGQGAGGAPGDTAARSSASGCRCDVGQGQGTRALWLALIGGVLLARRRLHGRPAR
jgi:hypothetical protein